MSILVSNSLIISGELVALYINKNIIKYMLKQKKYDVYFDNINQEIKESKNIIKYMMLYNTLYYIKNNSITLTYPIIVNITGKLKYPIYFLLLHQIYNKFISVMFNKNINHIKYFSLLLTNIGFISIYFI